MNTVVPVGGIFQFVVVATTADCDSLLFLHRQRYSPLLLLLLVFLYDRQGSPSLGIPWNGADAKGSASGQSPLRIIPHNPD